MVYDINGNPIGSESGGESSGDPDGVFPLFNQSKIFTKSTIENIPASMMDFYALYDAFLTKKNVTRNLLGYGSKSDGTADTSLPIYEYVVGNPIQLESTARISPAPLVLLTSGIHSDEKTAMMALYNFVAALFDSSNTIATEIRESIMFRIVPLCNPWGYDATTTSNEGRFNARGVNLNRNFKPYWDKGSISERGSAPYSELETQALKAWLDDYAPSALFHLDCHNHGRNQSTDAVFYIATDCPKHKDIFSEVCRGTRLYFNTTYGINYSSVTRYSEFNWVAGVSSECYMELGTDSSIIEQPYGNSTSVDNNYIRRECEFLGNLIYTTLQNYKY